MDDKGEGKGRKMEGRELLLIIIIAQVSLISVVSLLKKALFLSKRNKL